MKIGLIKFEKENGLFVSLPHLLDSMNEDDRKAIVAYACEDAVFMESVLNAVATSDQAGKIETTGAVDCWFGQEAKRKLRLALTPMLDEMVAEELTKAVNKAQLYERAHRHLESMAHIEKMTREADSADEKDSRNRQWVREYESAKALFPQYLPGAK